MAARRVSLHDFKNWMAGQEDLKSFFNIGPDVDAYAGRAARSKVGAETLRERMETQDDADALVEEFLEGGGTVLVVDGRNVHVEVASGSFWLPRFCVKLSK